MILYKISCVYRQAGDCDDSASSAVLKLRTVDTKKFVL